MEVFNIFKEKPLHNSPFSDYNYQVYRTVEADLTNQTSWTIQTQNRSRSYQDLSKAFIEVKCRLREGDKTQTLAGDNRYMVKNGPGMFSNVELRINGTMIENAVLPGVSNHLLQLVYQDSDNNEVLAPISAYRTLVPTANTTVADYTAVDAAGVTEFKNASDNYFVLMIKLTDLLGAADFPTALRGTNMEFLFTKNLNYNQYLYAANTAGIATAGGVMLEISKCSLWIPTFIPRPEVDQKLIGKMKSKPVHIDFMQRYATIHTATNSANVSIPVHSNQKMPRYMFVALQAKSKDAVTRLTTFDYGNSSGTHVKSMVVRVNGRQYPTIGYQVTDGEHIRAYVDYASASSRLFSEESAPILEYKDWRDAYPVFCFDLRVLEDAYESLSSDSVIDLEYQLSAAPGEEVRVHIVVLGEVHLKSSMLTSENLQFSS